VFYSLTGQKHPFSDAGQGMSIVTRFPPWVRPVVIKPKMEKINVSRTSIVFQEHENNTHPGQR
jgi:hypothetical protein